MHERAFQVVKHTFIYVSGLVLIIKPIFKVICLLKSKYGDALPETRINVPFTP